jgi:CheY-like chemotaxis protein
LRSNCKEVYTTSEPEPLRIVVVEDNIGDVILLKEALSSNSITAQITHFPNVAEAAKSLCADDNADIHLALIDLILPKTGRFRTAQADPSDTRYQGWPIAIFTSSQSEKDREEAHRLGANFYLPKPSDLEEFFDVVGSTILSLLKPEGLEERCSP